VIKRLSRRFTAAAVGALLCVEVLMVALINGLNAYYTVTQTDEIISTIIENKGKIPENPKPMRDEKDSQKPYMGRRESEMPYVTRYFTAVVDEQNNVDRIDTGSIASVTSAEAEQFTLEVIKGGKTRGFCDGYSFRYSIEQMSDGNRIAVFCDFSSKAETLLTMIEISAVIAAGLLVIFSVVIKLYSERAVRPVILSIENQRRFISDAGHELKTPLAIIRADAEVIELTGGSNEWTKSIVNQTDRLSKLLGQMLTLTKSHETGKLKFEEFNLSEAVRAASNEFTTLCNTRGKPLETQVCDDIICCGDKAMLSELVSILLDNAVKYGSDGQPIALALKMSGLKAELCVSNFCDDPPQGDANMLFERFYRADSSRTRNTGGSGIGLSIASSIAEAHKAKINCTVEANVIRFTLKIAASGGRKKDGTKG
jgi:hypothetical protein